MLRKIKDSTLNLLSNALEKLEIKSQIKKEDIEKIYNYFENQEIEFSIKQDKGIIVNQKLFEEICNAADDFFIEADCNDEIDVDYINKKLNL